ncbi:uncharacterized protein LOC110118923 [Ceratitis capitata]|uniref:uncharacterized protein LOC110118923 n=1 Tax=Ceratitis capitata TaxID=7213 RepID=UPI000A0F46AE|nr:uncharacterized protein LOC110118923 [Ceratitis capitata]
MAIAFVLFKNEVFLLRAIDSMPRSNGDNDIDDDELTVKMTPKSMGIASVKSRAIAMDRALCRELSRYHPHYPRCFEYCKKLNHWMGMCRRESCHCYS